MSASVFANNSTEGLNLTYNSTSEVQDEFQMLLYYILWTIIAPIIFGIITLVGIIGNTLVIYVILSRDYMQTATNFLLLNLAFSDLAFLVTCVPLKAYQYAATTWPLGDLVCKLFSYMIYVTAYVTVYTLVAISLLRYVTVIHGARSARYRTKRNVVILIVLIWVVTCAVNVPSIFIHRLKIYNPFFAYCGMMDQVIKPFFVTFFVLGYALPLVVICVLYVIVLRHLTAARGSTSMDQTRERTLRASKVIVVVVITFVLSWLPLHINQLLSSFSEVPSGFFYEVFRIFCNCMAYGNSCANPIIYNFGAQEFKKAYREIICCTSRKDERHRNTVLDNANGNAKETKTMNTTCAL